MSDSPSEAVYRTPIKVKIRQAYASFIRNHMKWLNRRHQLQEFHKSNIYKHAQQELKMLGWDVDRLDAAGRDDMDAMMYKHIMAMLFEFDREGHSGFSASYAISIIERLLRWEPLSSLRGTPEEFNDCAHGGLVQNSRDSAVFRESILCSDGTEILYACRNEGYVFQDPPTESGYRPAFTGRLSSQIVLFPFSTTEARKHRRYMDGSIREKLIGHESTLEESTNDLRAKLRDPASGWILHERWMSPFQLSPYTAQKYGSGWLNDYETGAESYTDSFGNQWNVFVFQGENPLPVRITNEERLGHIIQKGDVLLVSPDRSVILPVWREVYAYACEHA